MSPQETPSVAIDGMAIRRIREEKRLTQLYVAKVVGVTTDTVSRWENNRYPSIRRDNALNLAEALEVDLSEILRQDVVEEEMTSSEPPQQKIRLWLYLSLAILLLVGGWFLILRQETVTPVISVERLQPAHVAPGSHVLVRLQLSMEKPIKGLIVKEKLPAGWNLIDAVPQVSSLGSKGGEARWMLRNPNRTMMISYLLQVDPLAALGSQQEIFGEVIANPDGQHSSIAVSAQDSIRISALHWVDVDGDHVIDDMEILEVSDLFDGLGSLSDEWDKIEQIWDAGGYRWDEKTGSFLPLLNE